MELVNWQLLAQRLKSNRQLMIRNDTGLAKAIGVSQQLMSQWQKGVGNSQASNEIADLPFRAKIRMLELGGYERVKAFLLLGQKKEKIEKMEAKNRQVDLAWKESLPIEEAMPTEKELFLCEYSAVEDLIELASAKQ